MLFGCLGLWISLLLLKCFRFPVVRRRILWLGFLVCFQFGSIYFQGFHVRHRCCPLLYFALFFSETRIPTPPPLLFVLDLSVHLYPFINIVSPFFNIVSVIRAIAIFSVCSRDSRLFIFPLRPLTLMLAMVISLFFLILCLLFSVASVCFTISFCWSSLLLSVVSWFVATMVIGGTCWYLLLVFVLVLLSLFLTCLGCFLAAGAGCPLFRFMASRPRLSGAALGGVGFFSRGVVCCPLVGGEGCPLVGGGDCLLAGRVGCLFAGGIDCLLAGWVGCILAGWVDCRLAGWVGCLLAGGLTCTLGQSAGSISWSSSRMWLFCLS